MFSFSLFLSLSNTYSNVNRVVKRVDRRGKQIDRENLSSQYVLETIRLSGILNRIIRDMLVAKKKKLREQALTRLKEVSSRI